MNRRTQNTVALYVVLAVLALVLLGLLDSGSPERELVAAATFASFALVVYALPYALSANGSQASPAFVAQLASVMLAPRWGTAAIAAVSVALGELLIRRSPIKATFNVAQHTLAISAAIASYVATGGASLLAGAEAELLPLLSAWATFTCVNSGSVASVVAASTGRKVSDVWRENMIGGFVYDVLAVPFVVVFALIYAKFGPVATIGMLALLLILRQLHSTNEALHSSNRELLELTVTTLEARDPYTSGHSRRVAQYSRMIGQSLSFTPKQLERLAVAAVLHDVGKIHEVFAPILSKPGRLTPEERAVMETHPIKGAELVKISSQLRDAVEPIRHHHEAWDGSGYPDGIKGEEIPVFSRVIAIADTIDAMASDRPYRRGLSADKIRDEMVKMRGIQFDPAIIDQILRSGTLDSILRIAADGSSIAQATNDPKLSLVSSA